MIVGGWGIPESVMITSTLHPLPLACDLDVAPAVAHLILCPAAEVGQLRVAQLLDGQLVGVALPAVDVGLVMAHLLLVTPGQVIPGDLGQVSGAGQCHVIWTHSPWARGIPSRCSPAQWSPPPRSTRGSSGAAPRANLKVTSSHSRLS